MPNDEKQEFPFPILGLDKDGKVCLPQQRLPLSATLSKPAAQWLEHVYRKRFGTSHQTAAKFLEFIDFVKCQMHECQEALLSNGEVAINYEKIGEVEVMIISPALNEPVHLNDSIVLHLNDPSALGGLSLYTSAISVSIRLKTRVVIPNIKKLKTKGEKLNKLLLVLQELKSQVKNLGLMGEASGAEMCIELLMLAFQHSIDPPNVLGLIGISGVTGDWDCHNKYLDVTNLSGSISQVFSGDKAKQEVKSSDVLLDTVNDFMKSNMDAFPSCILLSGSRDLNFSSTVIHHQAMVRAGIEAELYIFDGLPQSFHLKSDLPESGELYDRLSEFFLNIWNKKHLGDD